jgi:hypothetical protein
MPATSVTGRGLGASKKFTVKDLAILANSPAICVAGSVETSNADGGSPPPSSPPAATLNSVTFPVPLEGASSNYVVMLTSQNGGYAYVTEMTENEAGDFIGFTFMVESDCTLMYMVVSAGTRPLIVN